MPGHPAEERLTIDDFIAWEGEPDTHYELVDGRIVAMAPPSAVHGAIMMNVGAFLRARLAPPCRPYAQAGVTLPDRDDTFYEADIAVSCRRHGRDAKRVLDPMLIVEILSPSTRTHDRGNKTPDYATIPTVQDILLIDSQRRRVQHWSRQSDAWVVRDVIGEGDVVLAVLDDGRITLDEIYEGVL